MLSLVRIFAGLAGLKLLLTTYFSQLTFNTSKFQALHHNCLYFFFMKLILNRLI